MTRLLYGITLFASAFLLFLVQPLVGRLLLPVLGGSAAVWTACLVFFQSALLAGYWLAHLNSRLPMAAGRIAHVAIVAAGLLALPLALGGPVEPPADRNPTVWLLQVLAAGVGLPFVALASNAPTLQRWFSQTRDPRAHNPYFLYSASNIGSLLGLIVYPVAFEPLMGLTVQRQVWSVGFMLLLILVAICAVATRGGAALAAPRPAGEPDSIARMQKLRWVALALVPSSLTAGVTAYVSTELAPVPLLWVLPLGLYLVTFIQAFAGATVEVTDRRVQLTALLAFPLTVWHVSQSAPTWALVLLHVGAVYVLSLLCHCRLYRERPPSAQLTSFYLWVALGGAIGGAFNALVAPAVFRTAAEYPLMLMAAAALLPVVPAGASRLPDVLVPRLVALLGLFWVAITTVPNPSIALWVPAGQIARQRLRAPRVRLVGALVVAFLFVRVTADGLADRSYVTRSFFGVHRVVDEYHPGYRALIHGATLHGMQATTPGVALEPVTYFTRAGPIGQVFAAHGDRLAAATIGVVGLGAGELASYATAGQRWTFFEIDEVVENIARERFDYLGRAPRPVAVTLGDGRLSIARSTQIFELLIMDAFSSDAIPRHLLTTEALRGYLGRLAPHGIIALHVSNRFVDLEPALSRLARAEGLAGLIQYDSQPAPGSRAPSRLASIWVVLARTDQDLGALAGDARWSRLRRDPAEPWTDEKADILTSIRWREILSLKSR